jgi:hypothetical protein
MILKNWYKALAAFMANDAANFYEAVDICGNKTRIRYDSDPFELLGTDTTSTSLKNVITDLNASKKYGVIFGNGTTPPSVDDWGLSGDMVLSGFTWSAATSYQFDDNGVEYTGVYTITNTTTNTDITIGEAGLFTLSNYGGAHILLERTVLDTPVTIPAGGVGKVTYTIRLNYPTA